MEPRCAYILRMNMTLLRLRAWAVIASQHGSGTLLRVLQREVEDRVTARGLQFTLRAMRAWHLVCIAVGAAICWAAPWPALSPTGKPPVASFLVSIAMTAVGAAIALRSSALLASTFSVQLMASGARPPLRPTLLRAAAVLVVAAVALSMPWPLSAWAAAATAGVLWAAWPLITSVDGVLRGVGYLRYRSPLRALLVQQKRTVPAAMRRLIAVHEAGHAVFFGLGRSFPEDLFAYVEEDIPTPDEVVQSKGVVVGGAVQTLNDLGQLWVTTEMGRAELYAMLGMVCGGTAAECVEYGRSSLSHLLDAGEFERRARLYLTLFPQEDLPFFCKPEGEHEAATNARSIAVLRERVEAAARSFLEANRRVLQALAQDLDRFGEMNVDQLAPHLARVQPAAGFERFDWPASAPLWSARRDEPQPGATERSPERQATDPLQ